MDQHPFFKNLLKPGGQPWDRLKGEPARAWSVFCQYREMGLERSLPKLAKLMNRRSSKRWQKWSQAWHWLERAQAYDEHLDKIWRESKEGEIAITAKRHKEMARLMQWISLQELQSYQAKITSEIQDAAGRKKRRDTTVTKSTGEVIRLGKEGALLERLVLGETTENPGKPDSDLDLTKLSTEELALLRELREKARKR